MQRNILIIGNAFVNEKSLPTQGQILRNYLSTIFYDVRIVSSKINLIARAIDIINSCLFIKPGATLILQVYGTRSIYLQALLGFIVRLKGCKLISTVHGGSVPDVYSNTLLRSWCLSSIFNNSAIITVPSAFIKISLPKYESKIKIINNYLSSSNFKKNKILINKDKIKILWIRAYHEIYNPIKAVEVAFFIKSQGFNVELIMAGPDLGLFEKTRMHADALKLSSNILFLKRLSSDEIDNLCEGITCYLCTNDIDNAPVTFIEMMARDIPIVTTNVGGIPFLVSNNETALISQNNTPEDLAALIIYLFNNPVQRDFLIQNGQNKLKNYQPDFITSQWVSVIDSI